MSETFPNPLPEAVPILDEDCLYRRIHPTQVKDDGSPSSAAFKDEDMSVDVARLTSPEKTLSEYPKYSLVSILAGFARALTQTVFHDPREENHAHAIVQGKKTSAIAKELARAARWKVRRVT